MASSSSTPSIGTSGRTSVAPTRGCAPEWRVKSISSSPLPTPRNAASAIASGSPARVMTERLWSGSISRSNTQTPWTAAMASTSASTLAESRPSEKFGTHSIRRFIRCGTVWSGLPLLTRKDNLPTLERQPAVVGPEIIRDFTIVGQIEHREVGELANLDRADVVVATERVGGVDRSGSEGFG